MDHKTKNKGLVCRKNSQSFLHRPIKGYYIWLNITVKLKLNTRTILRQILIGDYIKPVSILILMSHIINIYLLNCKKYFFVFDIWVFNI